MNVLVSIQQQVRAWQIPAPAIQTLRERFPHHHFIHATDDAERQRGLEDAEIALTWILNAQELARAPKLRWVHTSAVAVETLCLPELFGRNIIVSNSRGIQAVPIAEHVMAVMLALAKRLPFLVGAQRERQWVQNDMIGERLPFLLRRCTLGLIGVGTIGSEIATRAAAFGMRVVGVRRRADRGTVVGVDEMLPAASLPSLLERADVLVIAAPLTPQTEGLIAAPEFARMKRTAILINVGRARIVDHAALVDALTTGRLGGAALDVLPQEPLPADDPLWSLSNVIITPHTSGFRQGHWDDVIDLFSENVRRFEAGQPVKFQVLPELGY